MPKSTRTPYPRKRTIVQTLEVKLCWPPYCHVRDSTHVTVIRKWFFFSEFPNAPRRQHAAASVHRHEKIKTDEKKGENSTGLTNPSHIPINRRDHHQLPRQKPQSQDTARNTTVERGSNRSNIIAAWRALGAI